MTREGLSLSGVTLILCGLTALCEGIDLQAAGLAAAGINSEFSPTSDQLGTFFGASTLGLFLGAMTGGRLADSFGRKWVLVTSVAVFGVFSLSTPAAWSIGALTWARFLTGLGLGGALPLLVALASEVSSIRRQSANVALVYAGVPLGGGLSSILSLLIDTHQWRLLFWVGGVLPLLLCPLMAMRLNESIGSRRGAAPTGPGEGEVLVKSGSFAAIFHHGRALTTLLLWASFFFALLLLYLLLNWLPTLLVTRGLSHAQASAAQIGFNLGGAAAAVLIGWLLETRARNAAYIATFLLLPLLLILIAKSPVDPVFVAGTVLVLGCGTIAAQACLYTIAPSTYPFPIRGIGVGAAIAMGRVGSIVGPKLGGYLKSAGRSPDQILMDILPIVIVGSVCALLLIKYRSSPLQARR